jgi:antitoxin (DNA-binding transcriptional repressor) of toxin-antitoxin stability system
MKTIELEQIKLELYIKNLQHERVVITRKGKPLALLVGVQGLDEEQLQLGSSDKFWKLVGKWRKEKTINRAELEQKLDNAKASQVRRQKRSAAARKKQLA